MTVPTTDAVTRSPAAAGFRSPVVVGPVVIATVAVAAVTTVMSPPAWLSVAIVVSVIATLGIPHGAVDHLVVDAIDGSGAGSPRRRFVGNYLLAMTGAGFVWLASPPLALLAFLVLSVHHFGQSDLAYLRIGGWRQLGLQWSRGLLLVGLPLVAHVPTVAPVVEALGGGDPARWPWLVDLRVPWAVALVVQHVVVGAAAARRVRNRTVVGREAVTVAVLTLLFVTADPLIGFAVYFGLWHSLAHLHVLADLLGSGPDPMRSVLRLAAPLTAVSLVGLATVIVGGIVLGRSDLLVPILFVFISMVTVPHMVVVERLWRRPSRRRVAT